MIKYFYFFIYKVIAIRSQLKDILISIKKRREIKNKNFSKMHLEGNIENVADLKKIKKENLPKVLFLF